MFGALSTDRLARGSASHPWLVILAWVILFVAAGAAFSALFSDAVSSEFNLIGNHESKQARELLEDRLRGPRQFADIIVVKSETLTVDDPAFRQTVEAVAAGVQVLGSGRVVPNRASGSTYAEGSGKLRSRRASS